MLVAVAFNFGCKKKISEPNNNGGNNGGSDQPTEKGIYLGIIGFNQNLTNKEIGLLNNSTLHNYQDFIDELSMENGTGLYYADYVALEKLKAYPKPSNLNNVAMITFTDGLDNVSMSNDITNPGHYNSTDEYCAALSNRIKNEQIHGNSIKAYTIGIKGSDVLDEDEFQNNLNALASSPNNVFQVTDMNEALQRFAQIAESLYSLSSNSKLKLQLPGGYNDGVIIRFTFDNVASAENSTKYIECTYKRTANGRSLEDITYHGFENNVTVINSEAQIGLYYEFEFQNLSHINGHLVTQSDLNGIKLWRQVSSGAWQPDVEFTPDNSSQMVTEYESSAMIMLVLDCTTSLGNQFANVKIGAQRFVETLVAPTGNGNQYEKPTVTTTSVSDITSNSARCGGRITNDGGSSIISRGICWSTFEYPTINNDHKNDTTAGLGSFVLNITGLEANTTYYVRAYATNSIGTAYGDQETFTTSVSGGDLQHLPYTQSFETEFGTYITKNVIGDQEWTIDFSTAKMSGYSAGVYYENEDWLISSPVSITGVSHAKMVVAYIGRYFNDINADVTIWVSTNYQFGDMPSTASWIQIPASLEQASNWTDFLTAELSLDDFIGQTVTIAVKYVSTDTRAGTIEIQTISVEEGQASGGGETQYLPYTQSFTTDFGSYITKSVIGDQKWTIEYRTAKINGYYNGVYYENEDWLISSPVLITGVSHAKMVITYIGRYFNDINADVTIWVSTNYQFGYMPSTASWTQIPSYLEQGSNWNDYLTAELSLDDYIGQTITVAVKYVSDNISNAGSIQIQSISVEEGEVIPPTPPTPPTPGEPIYSNSFAYSQGDFTIQDVVIPGELTYIWAHASNFYCMKASAYVGQAYDAESWLISPYIDLTSVSSATLKFDQAVNYGTPEFYLSVMISTDYYGDVNTATWYELSLDQWPTGTNWTFISSTANLSQYIGNYVTIALKYTSTTSVSPTWEVKNFVVEE